MNAHDTYLGIAVGGHVSKTGCGQNPCTSSNIDKGTYGSYVVSVQQYPPVSINWNGGGLKYISNLSEVLDFSQFEWLAQNIKDNSNNGKVKVVTNGGNVDMCQFSFTEECDNGERMIVFNTNEDVTLNSCAGNGRKFGPSVLAPFSKVTLNSDFIDGFVVAREFISNNSNQQCHGDVYTGPLECV